MTAGTGIGHFQGCRVLRRDEAEGVRPDIDVPDLLFDLRHMTRDALVTGTARSVVGVRFYGGRVRTVG